MESLLTVMAACGAALLAVAVLVAWWEHVVRVSRPAPLPAPAPRAPSTVDVPLDALGELPAGDAPSRRATLDEAMQRAANEPPSAAGWVETQPMVGLGATRTTTEPH